MNIRYGRPPKGSRTEQRGLAAQAHIQQEMKYLCEIIRSMGQKQDNSTHQITFKQLFDVCMHNFDADSNESSLISSIQIFQTNSLVSFFEHENMVIFLFQRNMKYCFKEDMIM